MKLRNREALILRLLSSKEPRSVDQLIAASKLASENVLATLLVLEVKRLVRQLPGKRYVKTEGD